MAKTAETFVALMLSTEMFDFGCDDWRRKGLSFGKAAVREGQATR
jgi:hypothetical protein